MKQISCIVCGGVVEVRPARGRKSGKPFLMLVCGREVRHFRGFINDAKFVEQVVENAEEEK
jgi:hypothetical protein